MNQGLHNSIHNNSTFIVKINHACNETWQGEIVWAEENRKERFRSALEMMSLMDEAMRITQGHQDFDQHFDAG